MSTTRRPSALQAGGNMEGKEVRFGIANSALFATVTTDASCGAVNTMHDSLMPLGGMVPLVNIMLGEIIFGGVGSGLYGMLLFAIVAVFVAGLMVGRTPEYLGKKLEAKEVKMAMLAILILPLSMLGFTALATVPPAGAGGMANAGPHGFSEIAVRLRLGHRQQRQRLRRPVRQHAVLQHHAGPRDVHRPLHDDRADAGDRRLAGRARRSCRPRPAPSRPIAAVRRPAGRRDPDHRRPDLLPGPGARPIVEHFAMHAGTLYLSAERFPWKPEFPQSPRDRHLDGLLDPSDSYPGDRPASAFRKLDPRMMIRNPVMFVVEIVATLTTILFLRDLVTRAAPISASPSRSSSGCGSPCCSPTSPKRWPKGRGKAQAATLRRTAPRPWPSCSPGPARPKSVVRRPSSSPATSCWWKPAT
jgi:hypothetical protein